MGSKHATGLATVLKGWPRQGRQRHRSQKESYYQILDRENWTFDIFHKAVELAAGMGWQGKGVQAVAGL